jgi:TPR repeat protein
MLAYFYHYGSYGIQQDHTTAVELYAKAADLGHGTAHNDLGKHYQKEGDLKKAKFHFEAAAMAGDEVARFKIGGIEFESGNRDEL